MKKSAMIGILFTIVMGSVLHFTYEWSGKNNIVALFSAVNESTWEHLKLLFFPYIIYALFEYYYIGRNYSNYITAKSLGLLVGLLSIPILFGTYTSILGTNYLILDIFTFILAVFISYMVSLYILKDESIEFNRIGFAIIIILIVAFFTFTFNPLQVGIFLDPVTNTYGIQKF